MLRVSVNAAIWWSRFCRVPRLRWLPLRVVAFFYSVYVFFTH